MLIVAGVCGGCCPAKPLNSPRGLRPVTDTAIACRSLFCPWQSQDDRGENISRTGVHRRPATDLSLIVRHFRGSHQYGLSPIGQAGPRSNWPELGVRYVIEGHYPRIGHPRSASIFSCIDAETNATSVGRAVHRDIWICSHCKARLPATSLSRSIPR